MSGRVLGPALLALDGTLRLLALGRCLFRWLANRRSVAQLVLACCWGAGRPAVRDDWTTPSTASGPLERSGGHSQPRTGSGGETTKRGQVQATQTRRTSPRFGSRPPTYSFHQLTTLKPPPPPPRSSSHIFARPPTFASAGTEQNRRGSTTDDAQAGPLALCHMCIEAFIFGEPVEALVASSGTWRAPPPAGNMYRWGAIVHKRRDPT